MRPFTNPIVNTERRLTFLDSFLKEGLSRVSGNVIKADRFLSIKTFAACVIFLFTGMGSIAQTTIFSQDFSSSTSILSYVSLIPNSGQFDAISTGGTTTASITSGALRFTRGSGSGSFTRSTNFSPTPTAIIYKADVKVSGTPGANQNQAATFQVGSGYSALTNGLETNANTYAQFGIDFRGTTTIRFRDITNNSTTGNYNVGTTYSVTWAMNNSGSALTYTAPDGTTESIANDRMDVWIGTTKEFDDVTVQTTGGSLTDLKFAFTASTGNVDIDNMNIYSFNPLITTQPSSISRCVGASASFTVAATGTSLSYQWKKGGSNLSNGGSISGATTATLTINPVAAGDAAANYTVDVTSSGGYTASSNNTTLTVNALPTITTSSAATSGCYNSGSSQNTSLSYSATTGSPTTYTITWNATALLAGLVNVGSTALPASPVTVPVAAGVAAGTYTGTLAVTNGNGCTSTGNSFTVTINALPTITGTLTACVGSTTQLTGSGTAAASSPWVSASTSIATVNSTGLVTGVAAGTSVITYTDNNGCAITATVTISAPPAVTGVSICIGGSGSLTSSAACTVGSTLTAGANDAGTGTNVTGVGTVAWTNPGNITTAGTPYASVTLNSGNISNYLQGTNYGFAIPSTATINGISVTINRQASSTNRINDNVVRLIKAGSVVGSNLASGTFWGTSFATATYGSSSNLWGTTWTPADINASNFGVALAITSNNNSRTGTVDYIEITVTYTTAGTLDWYTVSSGGSAIGSNSPFNPVGVAGSGLANTNTAGTTTFYAECASLPGCRGTANFVINPLPTITTSATAATVCSSSSAQNSSLSYSATTNSPTNYTITWDAAALSAGLVNLGSTPLPVSPVTVPVAAGVAAGTYTGTLTVTNANSCSSAGNSFTLTILASPTITASATALSKCFSSSSQGTTLTYSATTNSPTNYTITWNAAALSAGLVNVGSTSLPASPVIIPVAAGVAAGTYTGTLTVTNAAGCPSPGNTFTFTVNPLPTITASASATGKCFSTSAQNSSLSYSASTGSPTLYSITWDATALSAGLVNVGNTALPASPITVPVAANVAAATYNGTLAVMNGFGCIASPTNSFTLTISNTFPVMTSASAAAVCTGGTVSIPLTSDIASTYTWVAANNTNVSGESTTTQTTSTLSNTLTSSSGVVETVAYTVTPTSTGGCTGSSQGVTVTVNPLPTITTSATALSKCFSSGTQGSLLNYSATTNSPTQYTITWDAAALAAGLVNVGSTSLPASPIVIPIAAGVAPGSYTGTVIVTNSNGCASTGNTFTLTIVGLPSITSSSTATTMCFSSSAQNSSLSYSATTGSPTLYKITWDAAALAAGLVNVGYTSLPASPITVPVAANVAAGTYNGTLVVLNGFGCGNSPANTFTLTINGSTLPVMTSASTASVCTGGIVSIPLTSNVSSTYTWIAASNANVTGESTTLQSTSTLSNTLTLSVASAQSVIYTVTPYSTAGGCQGTPQTVTVTVNTLPTITPSATATAKCYSSSSQTTTLSYSATTGTPTLYSITWNAAALTAGLVNVSSATLSSSPITIAVAAGVAAGTYTGTLTVTNANGCTSTGNSFTFTINAAPSITTQPTDQTACIGSAASFSIAATGTSLTYQWRKGTTNITNGGTISGATTATLSISSVVSGDGVSNYNCVVTGSSCSSVISNYVSLTANASAAAPTAQPTALVFPTVNTTSILGSFTASASATYYLVVRKTTNVAPTNPSNGTTYTQGTSALGGTIDYVGTSITFISNGLSPNTTYYYWVFAYNTSTCGTSPLYYTTSPLSGNATTATTVSCGTVTTLYWGGKGSGLSGATTGTDFNTAANWSTSSSSYVASPAAPSQCNTVSMALTSASTITLSANASVYNFTYTISANNSTPILSTEGHTLTVNGDAVVDVLSGNTNTSISIGENSGGSGIIDFKANFRIGETNYSSGNVPKSYLIGNANSKITFRGDVLFGRSARFYLPGNVSYPPSYPLSAIANGTTPGTIEFDGLGLQQVLWNNNVWYDCFYNIVVGNQNHPYVKHVTGTYTPDNILNNFTINDGATVDLATSQWIREQQGGTLTMNGTAKLILGNNQAVQSSWSTGVTAAGSNFPAGFTTMNIASTSTIEYNGINSITQTVYGTPATGSLTYGNLILSNGSGTGTASKINTSTVTVAGATTVSDKTTLTLGAGFTSNGAATINSGGRVDCGTNTVSGSGSFTVASGGTLGIASTSGITASCSCGNVQTTTRSFGTGGNYVYYGSSAQPTGDGLPRTMNNLTISNASGVTMYAASANYTVAGTLTLTSGALTINGDSLTINSLQRSSGTLTGSSTSSVGISGTSVPLFFTSGGRTLKNLFLNSSASADLQTSLDITAGSSAGSVAVASGATLNTFGNLTLKSDANGTARISQIPVDGSGNALGTISGNVQIERYIPAKRGWRMMTSPVQTSGAPTINTAWQEGVVNTDYVFANNLNPNAGFGLHISGASSSLGFDPTPLNNPSLLVFSNSAGTWSGISNTLSTLVTDYPGYMLFVRGSRGTNLSQNTSAATSNTVLRVLGKINAGKQTLNVSAGGGTYAIAGNPYCSTIDFRDITSTGGVSTSSYVMWDPSLTGTNGVGAYQYFTRTGGAGTDYTVFPGSSAYGGGSYGAAYSINNFVQAGQAFLVPKSSSAGTLVINETAKVSSSKSTVFRPMPAKTLGRIGTLLSAVADTTVTLLDGALSLYKDDFSDDMDVDDVRKIKNISSESFGIKTGGTIIAIEKKRTLSEVDTIFYNIRSLRVRNYQLAIDALNLEATGLSAYLEDNYTKSRTELKVSGVTTYPFSVSIDSGAWAPDRFRIVFKEIKKGPAGIVSINAAVQNNTIKVEWKMENEKNIAAYDVEKSADGIHFTKVYSEQHIANNGEGNVYEWIDAQPLKGLNYFRVRATGLNNRVQYTRVVQVLFTAPAAAITVFPNPVTDGTVNLYFNGQKPGVYTVRIFSNGGQLIQTQKLQQVKENDKVTIQLNSNLIHGNYMLEVIRPDRTTEKINLAY